MIRRLKCDPATRHVQVIGGNVATRDGRPGARRRRRRRASRSASGPGSICTTRVVAGVGVPQVTADLRGRAGLPAGRRPGDRRRRPAVLRRHRQGARRRRRHRDARLAARRLRGEPGRPGLRQRQAVQVLPRHGLARRDGSRAARSRYSKDRYFQADVASDDKIVPEGIEGQVRLPRPARPRSPTSSSAACASRCSTSARATVPELQERGPLRPDHLGRAQGEPPARHPDDRRGAQLLAAAELA